MKNAIEITSKAGKTFVGNYVPNNDHLIEIYGTTFYMSQGLLKSQGQVVTFCEAMGFDLNTPAINIDLSEDMLKAVREWFAISKVSIISTTNYVDVHEHGESVVSQETWLMSDGSKKVYEKRLNF